VNREHVSRRTVEDLAKIRGRRTQTCGKPEAGTRLAVARAFIDAADLVLDEDENASVTVAAVMDVGRLGTLFDVRHIRRFHHGRAGRDPHDSSRRTRTRRMG
jgi:hypothetical protein